MLPFVAVVFPLFDHRKGLAESIKPQNQAIKTMEVKECLCCCFLVGAAAVLNNIRWRITVCTPIDSCIELKNKVKKK